MEFAASALINKNWEMHLLLMRSLSAIQVSAFFLSHVALGKKKKERRRHFVTFYLP
jgi:hypothetical protein